MDRLLQSHARTNTKLALVVLDIRFFGRVNDSFGKAAGDDMLKLIAKRLGSASQFGCARISGNTFALALAELRGESEVAAALKTYVLEPLSQPFLVDGHEFTVAVRCGIALFDGDGDGQDIEELFGNAEAALKSAKTQGEEYLFYTSDLNARVADQFALESELRKAIAGAHALKLTVVAEGVETEQQRAQLQRMDCDELQGLLLGRPMRGKDVEMMLHHVHCEQ